MTTKKHLKRRARARVAETGEPYATALRMIRHHQENRMQPHATPDEDVVLSCSFCGKPDSIVQRLVAGPGVYICDECVGLSAAIIEAHADLSDDDAAQRRSAYQDRSTAEILASLPALVRSADRTERELTEWIARLRARGTDWPAIADATGLAVDAARQRFDRPPIT